MRKVDETITVFGLGKMGLPIAVAYADAGYNVIGVDVKEEVVHKINQGEVWFREPGLDEKLNEALEKDRIHASLDHEEAIEKADVIIVIVPLVLDEEQQPDFQAILDVTKKIGKGLRKEQIIIYETTLPPKTTEEILKPKLERSSGLKAGHDFGLFVSPERLYSLHVFEEMKKMKKVLGPCQGSKSTFTKRVKSVLKDVYKAGIVVVNNAATAEMTKLAETSFRAVNIAFANEIAKITDEVGVDVNDVIHAANTHRYTNILRPGAGVGGHCMPVYPYFLIKKYPDLTKLISEGQEINESMPAYMVELTKKGIKQLGKKLECSAILILGLAYRPNVKESMNSPTLEIVRQLRDKVEKIAVYDPVFSKSEVEEICQTTYWNPKGKENNQYDAVLVATGYEKFKEIIRQFPSNIALIDGRNLIDEKDRFLVYKAVGRGDA